MMLLDCCVDAVTYVLEENDELLISHTVSEDV